MVDFASQQSFVQLFIYVQEKVSLAAINYYRQVAIFYSVYLIHYAMLVPRLFIGGKLSQPLGDFPISRKHTYVYPAAGASACAEGIFMPEGNPQCAVSAHAQAGDGTGFPVGYRRIMGVDILHQFRRNKGFVTVRRILRTVPIPTVLSVGTNENDSFFIGNLRQVGLNRNPALCISAVSVKQVNNRTSHRFLSAGHVGDDRHYLNIALHRRASYPQRVYSCRESDGQRKQKSDEQEECFLMHTDMFLFYYSCVLSEDSNRDTGFSNLRRHSLHTYSQ